MLSFRVPTVPVKNLNGSSPVHPALAGKYPHTELTFKGLNMLNRESAISSSASIKTPLCFAVFRHHRDSDECSRTSCVPDQTSKAGASPTTCQQERHQAGAWSGPLLQEDHQETGPQRCFFFCCSGRILPVQVAPSTDCISCILQARPLRRLSRGISRKSAIHQRRSVLVTRNC